MEPMLASAGVILSRRCVQQKQSSDDRQPCLGNPCPKGPESTLTENVASPFHAEPGQVAVASTLDAITSDRPYRAAQSLQYAREEIERWWGRQFDPEVVKVFLEMPENTWVDLRKQIGTQT
jgi:hypothetical protein